MEGIQENEETISFFELVEYFGSNEDKICVETEQQPDDTLSFKS